MHKAFDSPLSVIVNKKGRKFILNLNNYRNTHYQTLNKAKIIYKDEMLTQLTGVKFKCPIEIEYCLMPKTARRTDLGNVGSVHQKYFEDALVELNCIPDDDYTHIVRTTFVFGHKDKDDPRVIITVTEV
jgi:hypothetical protein